MGLRSQHWLGVMPNGRLSVVICNRPYDRVRLPGRLVHGRWSVRHLNVNADNQSVDVIGLLCHPSFLSSRPHDSHH